MAHAANISYSRKLILSWLADIIVCADVIRITLMLSFPYSYITVIQVACEKCFIQICQSCKDRPCVEQMPIILELTMMML